MRCKAPIHAEAWDEVVKDDAKVEAAFDQLLVYINEFNFQMARATANAADGKGHCQRQRITPSLKQSTMMTLEIRLAVSLCISYSRPLLTSTCRRD